MSSPMNIIKCDIKNTKEKYTINVDDYLEYALFMYPTYISGNGYVWVDLPNDGRTLIHRYLLNTHKHDRSITVDHINGNRLDNVRENLRVCTYQQNIFNSKKRKGNYTSKYKGVCYRKGIWRAVIKHNGKQIYLGHHKQEIEAARAYDVKAREIFGKYARTNFED